MRIYESGTNHSKNLLMFQCAVEPVWLFFASAKALSKDFHVFLAAADGHDPNENSTFTTVEDYAGKTVSALKKRGITHLDALYGCSMGGAAAMYLLAHHLMPVGKAVIDAGITPSPYPLLLNRLLSYKDFCLIPLATISLSEMKMIMDPKEWTPDGADPDTHYARLYNDLKHHYSLATNYNVFWSANNYHMPDPVPYIETKMQYWYGSREKRERKNDLAYIRANFPDAEIIENKGYEHAQLVMIHPALFAEKALAFFKS